MDFDFAPMPLGAWRALIARAPQANLPQSWPYARAMRRQSHLVTRTAVMRRAGEPVGVFQIQELTAGPLHMVQLHRGPLWFDAAPRVDDWSAFFDRFRAEFPKRPGRWRRLMPDLPFSEDSDALIRAFGFKPRGAPYETVWLDLRQPLERLRARLKRSWRHALNRADQVGLDIEIDAACLDTDWFVQGYGRSRNTCPYPAVSTGFLRTLIHEAALFGDAWLLRADRHGETVGGVLLFRHGTSATYQAGWTNRIGQAVGADHRLVWAAIEALQADGITHFDLGGLHPEKAESATHFKLGLNGRHCVMAGVYG